MRKYFFLLIFIAIAGRLYFYFKQTSHYPDGTKLRIRGQVLGEPVEYSSSRMFFLKGFRIFLPLYPEVDYGDTVVVEGVSEGNSLKNANLVKIDTSKNLILENREKLLKFYETSLPQDHAALVTGITIGSKSLLTNEFWQRLKKTGTAHVVVASGMNVALVAAFLMSSFVVFLPRRKAIPFCLLAVWIYAVFAGFDAPIVRAAIMGSIAFVAQELGREYYSIRATIFSVSVMIFANPSWVTDIGFLLTFVATTSIILFEKRIRVLINKTSGIRKVPDILRKDFSTTLAAQIGVAPILFTTFGQFNILSPLINVGILWTVPLITMIGMLAGFLGLLFEPLGKTVLLLTYPLTSWFIFIIKIFS